MKRALLLIGAVLALGVLGGCDLVNGDADRRTAIRTNATQYIAPNDTIRLTVTNRSDAPIYYICTGQVFLDEYAGDERTNSWMVHGFEECLAPRPIDPGAATSFEIPLSESALVQLDGALFTDAVHYRLRADLYADDQFDDALPCADRHSNRFSITSSASARD